MNNLSLINRYFNYGYTGRTGKIISIISPDQARHLSAQHICDSYNAQTASSTGNPHSISASFTIQKFESKIAALNEISDYIRTYMEPHLHSALVHGSVATGEIINYSDFDGLVVIKNDVFKNRKLVSEVSYHLNRTFAMMLRFDPVQHHGWMIATEKDFEKWPAEFFPPALFQYSKSLLGRDCQLTIKYDKSAEMLKAGFLKYADRLNLNLKKTAIPDNAYQLKSILSEFMLLPSLYVAARDGKGIFKKFSFEMAEADFNTEEWRIMKEVSEIRMKWPNMNYVTGLSDLESFTPYTKKLQIRNSRFPDNQSPVSNQYLFKEMSDLTEKMILKLT